MSRERDRGERTLGHAEIRVSCESGEVHYEVGSARGVLSYPGRNHPGPVPEQTPAKKDPPPRNDLRLPIPHLDRFFDRIAIYDIDPKLPKKGVVITGKRELEADAGNLALVVKTILGDPEKKRKFSNLLRDILPFVEEVSVQKFMDVSLILTLRERYTRNRDLPASSLSDGTITIFALIVALYFEDKPFIIIEER